MRVERLSKLWADAVQGNPVALCGLGYAFHVGKDGLMVDTEVAVRFYTTSAEAGSVTAMSNLAIFFGEMGHPDNAKRFYWAKRSASMGKPKGQNILGVCYEYGIGTAVDHAEALRCYQLSADQEDAEGEYNLARLYHSGFEGFRANLSRALKYYRRAAQHGHQVARAKAQMLEQQGVVAKP
jgi:hypothetical protein